MLFVGLDFKIAAGFHKMFSLFLNWYYLKNRYII